MDEFIYDAFISYSHRDMKWARRLQRRLESFPVPRDAERERPGNAKMKVFRDQTDLAGTELQPALQREMERSRYLIVICTPAAAASRWVNEEIRYFSSLGRQDRVIPFVVEGEPNSDRDELECFPPALRSDTAEELMGVSIREIGSNKAFLKAVSILLGIRFNRLVDREKKRRRRRILGITAAAVVAAAVTGGLLWRNAVISRKNQQLSYDVYGAAMVSFYQGKIGPEEVTFLQESAEAGNVDAMMLLADEYRKGWDIEADPDAAFLWYTRAAEAGNAQGMTAVGDCYATGTGTEADIGTAVMWYAKAAEAGDVNAVMNLGTMYELIGDYDHAFECYQQAAQAGDEQGMYKLAGCYRSGQGVEADAAQAFAWMKKLAEAGNVFGMYNVAMMYQYAYGTEENPREAYLWYRKAAEAGDAEAMRMTGWCIENRYGVEDAALEWYEKAAEAGDPEAPAEAERIRNGK